MKFTLTSSALIPVLSDAEMRAERGRQGVDSARHRHEDLLGFSGDEVLLGDGRTAFEHVVPDELFLKSARHPRTSQRTGGMGHSRRHRRWRAGEAGGLPGAYVAQGGTCPSVLWHKSV